ncbi:MAG: hypothetical protein M9894_10925 [Planctomycetes bacterium]|nr:hypothetical protein [Planctomycetota bacterium]
MLDETQRFYEALRLQFVIGAADAERVYAWSRRLLEVERGLYDGAGPYERHLGRIKRLERDLDARPRGAAATEADRGAVEFFLLEAALWDAGARAETVEPEVWTRRIAAARRRHKEAQAALEAGQGQAEGAYRWSTRLQQAERDLDAARDRALLQAHLDRVLRLEGAARARALRGGLARPSDLPAAEFFRWEAEFYVLVSKEPGMGDDRRRKAFTDAWGDAATNAFEAALGEFRAGEADVEHVHLWSLRRFDAERVRGPDAAACEAHLARVQRLERDLRARDDYGLGLALGALECFRLDAQARVARARAAGAS